MGEQFHRIKRAKVDRTGRFYIPRSVVANMFAGVPPDQWRVHVYLGPDGQALLRPIKPKKEVHPRVQGA